MTVLTNIPLDRPSLASAFGDESRLVVVSFCAAWCDTCGEFRAAYERIAAARPDMRFVWLDIEDDSAVAGDINVENFPTLAVYRGVSLPQEGTVARLIDALSERTEGAEVPDSVRALARAFVIP